MNTDLILGIANIEGILLLDAFNFLIAQKAALSIPEGFMVNQAAFIEYILIMRGMKAVIPDHKQHQSCSCDKADLKQGIKGNW